MVRFTLHPDSCTQRLIRLYYIVISLFFVRTGSVDSSILLVLSHCIKNRIETERTERPCDPHRRQQSRSSTSTPPGSARLCAFASRAMASCHLRLVQRHRFGTLFSSSRWRCEQRKWYNCIGNRSRRSEKIPFWFECRWWTC